MASRFQAFLLRRRSTVAAAIASSSAILIAYNTYNNNNNNENDDTSNFARMTTVPRIWNEGMVASLRARRTIKSLRESVSSRLSSRYSVDWKRPLGRGSFGVVYMGTDKITGERVAIKKISHAFSERPEIQLELQALVFLKEQPSGHPNICSLRESYSENGYFYLVLDLIEGCEMFDYLVDIGIYSEADAARLLREAASAVAYLHGLGVTHGDMKPENLMLSSMNASDAVVKLIDFGCALIAEDGNISYDPNVGKTIAYCPPEVLSGRVNYKKNPKAADMWALGVILYIMLTGTHPFDLSGQASDKEVADCIIRSKSAPLRDTPLTAHLSDSAIDLIEKLLQRNPAKRLTAHEMLEHPWTRGITARRDKMIDASKKLALFKEGGVAEKVFESIVAWSDDSDSVANKTSLVERAFRSLDPQRKGYLTKGDLRPPSVKTAPAHEQDETKLSLSDVSHLLADYMTDKYFPRGHVIYKEGDVGEAMYFINSGTISVQTESGSTVQRGPGDFFGEGALFHPEKIRSATILCDTPVHAIEIGRSYFEQVVAQSDPELLLTLLEKDKIRKRNRAKMILGLQSTLVERHFDGGETIFNKGDQGDNMYLVQSGKVRIHENNKHVFTATQGNVVGEYSVVTGRSRNSTAVCDGEICVLQELAGSDFRALCHKDPGVLASLRDLCLRRDFKKAVVLRLRKEFPYESPREAFNAVRTHRCPKNQLNFDAIASLMRELNPDYTDEEIEEIIETINLSRSGTVTFEEFKKVFIADIRKSQSI